MISLADCFWLKPIYCAKFNDSLVGRFLRNYLRRFVFHSACLNPPCHHKLSYRNLVTLQKFCDFERVFSEFYHRDRKFNSIIYQRWEWIVSISLACSTWRRETPSGKTSDLEWRARSRVDFPAPFRPTKPYRLPFDNFNSASCISWHAPNVRSKFSIRMSPDSDKVAFDFPCQSCIFSFKVTSI